MANDLNRCEFIGRLGKDVELKYLPDGKAVANLSIACGESWTDKKTNEKVEKTEWVNLSVFGKLAEIMGKYLKKGSKVYVAGKFHTRKYQADDGSDRWATSVIVSDMQMLDSKPQATQEAAKPKDSSPPEIPEDFDEDIPF